MTTDSNHFKQETGTNEILNSLHQQVTEEDWSFGINLYQTKSISAAKKFSGLFTAQVNETHRIKEEVRLRVRPDMRHIQWAECSCHHYRKKGQYCSHIVAFVFYLTETESAIFSKLSFRAKGTRKKESKTESISATQSFLNHLKGTIVAIDCLDSSFSLTIEDIRGNKSSHISEIDSLANYIKDCTSLARIFQAKKYNFNDKAMTLGLYIYESKGQTITITPAAGQTLQKNSKPDFPLDKQCQLGEKFLYNKKLGFFPIKNTDFIKEIRKTNLKRVLKDEAIAIFFEQEYPEIQKKFPCWVEQTLIDSNQIKEPSFIDIKELGAKDGWFYLAPEYKVDQESIPMTALIEAFHSHEKKFYKTKAGWIKIPEYIKDSHWKIDSSQEKIALNKLGLLRLQAFMGKFDKYVGSKKIFELENSSENKTIKPSMSSLQLRGYQEEGLTWLCWLYNNGLHGLLADDMGLGKTHQAMALMACLVKAETKSCRFLVICPTTVIDHWHNKISTFCPSLNPQKYHGSQRKKSLLENEETFTCLTSYGVLLRDHKLLTQIKWDVVILDEAHYIKNDRTATYKTACMIESKFRLCLTGTPMENDLEELKNIFDFLIPGYLGSKQFFRKEFMSPIMKKHDIEKEHTLKKLIYPLKLRRTKSMVLKDLPSKIEDLRYCYLSKEQAGLYQKILQSKSEPILRKLEQGETISYLHIFKILQLLKQACNHPALIYKKDDFWNYKSGKFELLKDLLQESLDSQQKIVIFTQYVKMLHFIESYCKHQKIKTVSLTGSTQNRGAVIKQFQEDPETKVFIGSLLAGGVGIDLTAASVVIHYDRWWNPSKENQATDRVYRIGQKNSVQVFKLVTKGTLEEKIDQMITEKAKNFSKFMNLDHTIFKSLTRENIISLLR